MRTSRLTVLAVAALLTSVGCRPLGRPRQVADKLETTGIARVSAPADPLKTVLGKEMIEELDQIVILADFEQDLLDATGMEVAWVTPVADEIIRDAWYIDKLIFVETESNRLYCIDTTNGYIKWRYYLRAPTSVHPVLAEDTVYAIAENTVHAIDLETGYAKWRSRPKFPISSAPFVGEYLYCGSWNFGFHALRKRTDYFKWRVGTGGAIVSQGYSDAGIAYFASEDGNVYAYSPSLRKNVWTFHTTGRIQADLIADGKTIYVGSCGFSVYAIDMAFGKKKWRFRCNGPIKQNMQISKVAVYATSEDEGLFAISKESGEMKWFVPNGRKLVALTPDRAYVSLVNGKLCAVDRANGKILWERYQGKFRDYIAAADSGVVFGLVSGGQIAALRQKSTSGHSVVAKVPAEPAKVPAEPAKVPAEPAKVPAEPVKEPEPEAAAVAIDPLTAIPQAVNAVVKVDIRKLITMEAVKKQIDEADEKDLKKFEDMGIDFEKDLDHAAVGIAFAGDEPDLFITLMGRFDLAKVEQGIREKAAAEKVTLKDAEPHKDVKILFKEAPDPLATALLSEKAILMSSSVEGVKKMIDLAQGGTGCVLNNAPLAGVTDDFGCKKPIWAAMVLTEKVKEELAKNPMTLPILQADSILLAIDIPEGGVDLSLTADCSSEDGASGIATAANGMKGMIGAFLKGPDGKPTPEAIELMNAIKVETKGKQMIVQVAMTAEQIEKLEAKVPAEPAEEPAEPVKPLAPADADKKPASSPE